MRALEDTIASLGSPMLVRTLVSSQAPEAMLARWRHGGATVEIGPSDTVQLAMSLIDGRYARSGSGGALADRVRSGSISVFPPAEGESVSVGGDADVLQLFVRQAYAEALLETRFASPPMFDLRDDRLQAIILQILVGSAGRGPDDGLLVEEGLHGLVRRIDDHATRRLARAKAPAVIAHGGLAPTASRRVEELINAALDKTNSPSLLDMAAAADLSVTHFVRTFRQQKGATPHQYLVRRRMERAVSLLRTPQIPVAEVADATGFSSPAHFVATFRTAMGVTPAAVREALAN